MTWQDKLDRTGIGSDPLWVLDHRVLGKTWHGVFLGLGFLRGAPLCVESEGSRSPIDDRVVRFQPRQTKDDGMVRGWDDVENNFFRMLANTEFVRACLMCDCTRSDGSPINNLHGTGVDFLTTGMLCRVTNVWLTKEEVAPKSTNANTYGISFGIRMISTCWVKLGLGPTAEQEPLQRWCWVRPSRTTPTVTRCSHFPILGEFPQLALKVWQAFEGTGEQCALGCHSRGTGCLPVGKVSQPLSKVWTWPHRSTLGQVRKRQVGQLLLFGELRVA
jgi:hypothetical protein